MAGYLFLFLSVLSMGLMGVVSKVSEIKRCNPLSSSAMLFFWAAVLIGGRLLYTQSRLPIAPPSVLCIAIPFGFMGGIAFVAFLSAIEYGEIATSWLVVSLSPIVPAIASVLIYKEVLQEQRTLSLLFIGASLILLYFDKRAGQADVGREDSSVSHRKATSRWLRLMIVVFFCTALGAFGLKILDEAGLSRQYRDQYLFYWYLAGFVVAAAILLIRRIGLRKSEIVIGAFLGAASLLGNGFFSLALARNIAGYIAFPIVGLGSTLVVMAAGLLIFRERLTRCGYIGAGLGLFAMLLLAM